MPFTRNHKRYKHSKVVRPFYSFALCRRYLFMVIPHCHSFNMYTISKFRRISRNPPAGRARGDIVGGYHIYNFLMIAHTNRSRVNRSQKITTTMPECTSGTPQRIHLFTLNDLHSINACFRFNVLTRTIQVHIRYARTQTDLHLYVGSQYNININLVISI